MRLIPEVKEKVLGERRAISGCTFVLPNGCDNRIVNLTKKVPSGPVQVTVKIGNEDSESYKILFGKEITVEAKGEKGAFYAIQTIRQIVKNGYCDVKEINDSPDFEVRGFYYDITRGRIPTLESLKKLVDTLAYHKINMLQLYVEHVFPFKEYDGIYQRTGYITAEETRELDAYCKENYIELVPSLSCFGHLFELLETEKYKHLCELPDHKPNTIYWQQRMAHHTIDPSNPESFELIKSLIDQYMPLFTSDKFNICCDETFDLGKGRNAGKDVGQLYVGFVKKILDYVRSKGKTPMMWGDIINAHSEFIDELGETIFLSWGYGANEKPDTINKLRDAGKTQYVCPGCNNWTSLIEMVQVSIPNIYKMTKYGYEAGAKGVLNTCWGDYGHISPIYACMYSIIYGAARSWNATCEYENYDEAMDLLYYGHEGGANLVKSLAKAYRSCYWYELVCDYSNRMFNTDVMKAWRTANPEELNEAFGEVEELIPYLMSTKWENEDAREALLCVANGTQCMIAMLMSMQTGEKLGMNDTDVEEWLKEFTKIYLKESKMGELKDFVKAMYELSIKYLK
ncbi:MAG: hypothetical protein E7596_03405 [Ruminococcaceae bacterium]|nr:hypothetical protein [Oscillospiraceae bacterium]